IKWQLSATLCSFAANSHQVAYDTKLMSKSFSSSKEGTMTSPTHIITKSRSRKRSRQSKSSVTEPPLQTPPPVAPPLTVPPTAIQPEHVHEAIRRYMCSMTGPHLPFTSHFMKQKFRNRSV
uniref:Uncharacterized protein n=1 Tax=Amphimedon queenslandica TaxID=400682 RepID=A0A1X7TPB6_AMPQE